MIICKHNFSFIPLVLLLASLLILEVPVTLSSNNSGNDESSNANDFIDALEDFERWCTSPSASRGLTGIILVVVIFVFWYLMLRKRKK
jgi:hypothetical protein